MWWQVHARCNIVWSVAGCVWVMVEGGLGFGYMGCVCVSVGWSGCGRGIALMLPYTLLQTYLSIEDSKANICPCPCRHLQHQHQHPTCYPLPIPLPSWPIKIPSHSHPHLPPKEQQHPSHQKAKHHEPRNPIKLRVSI